MVVITNGLAGLYFAFIQPNEFNGIVYLIIFIIGLIPMVGVYPKKTTLIFCCFFLVGGIIPYVLKILTFGSDELFSTCFILITSAYFIVFSNFLKSQRDKSLKELIDLRSLNETSEKRYENAKALIEELKNKNKELNKLEKVRKKCLSCFDPQN